MTITISASPREEPTEANLIDSPTKSKNSALANTENTPASPTTSENRDAVCTFITGQSASRLVIAHLVSFLAPRLYHMN